jgi:hypothetical protein
MVLTWSMAMPPGVQVVFEAACAGFSLMENHYLTLG